MRVVSRWRTRTQRRERTGLARAYVRRTRARAFASDGNNIDQKGDDDDVMTTKTKNARARDDVQGRRAKKGILSVACGHLLTMSQLSLLSSISPERTERIVADGFEKNWDPNAL